MRIVIDMQGAQGASRDRGIGRYTRSLVREILNLSHDHDVFLLFNGMLPESIAIIRQELRGLFKYENQRVWFAQAPISADDENNATRRQLAEIIWEAAVEALAPDHLLLTGIFEGYSDDAIAHVPAQRSYTVSAILYDLIPLVFNQTYLKHPPQRNHYSNQLTRLRQCDHLLAISDYSALDARRFLKIDAGRITTIGAAIDADFATIAALPNTLPKQLDRPFLLYVSGADERKNQRRLISAFARLPDHLRNQFQLVLVGSMPEALAVELQQHAATSGLIEGSLVVEASATEAMLRQLYAECHAFVFPSWYEGFGLPILEAMAFGKAVIAANSSSIPEIILNPDALFDPFDIDDISQIIERLLSDDSFRQQLASEGCKIVEQFSWQNVASRALSAIDQVAGNGQPFVNMVATKALSLIRSCGVLDEIPAETVARHLGDTLRPHPLRQLLLDISELVERDAKTGIQRVVRSLLGSLLADAPKGWVIEPIFSRRGEQGFHYARAFTDQFLGMEAPWHHDDPVTVWAGDIYCALDLNHGVLLSQQPTLDEWQRRGASIWTVVYDILPLRLPAFFPPSLQDLHQAWLKALHRYDGAMCISKAVADEVAQWLQENDVAAAPLFRTEWFHLGADLEGSAPTRGMPDDAVEVLKLLATRPSALMVGTVEPRKGHAQTLAAFDILWGQGSDINLVIVGKEGWDVENLVRRLRNHPERGKRLFWLPGISDEYLDRLYEVSTVLIAASEGEGFGLPLIEAAQKQLPLIVRDIPVFREVAGTAAHYFADTLDPADLATAVAAWLVLQREGLHPKSDTMAWMTWNQSAMQFFERLTGADAPSCRHKGDAGTKLVPSVSK